MESSDGRSISLSSEFEQCKNNDLELIKFDVMKNINVQINVMP